MVAPLTAEPMRQQSPLEILRLLTPEPLADGAHPEYRATVGGISWRRYSEVDAARDAAQPGLRLYYLKGVLEILTVSNEHERVRKWIDKLLDIYLERSGLDEKVAFRGQATIRRSEEAAAEPDESWCFGEEKEMPDLVLEVALSSGGVRKLDLYRRLGIAEVWIWRNGSLEMYGLSADASGYEALKQSQLVAGLDRELLERCVHIKAWLEARRIFREGLES